MEKKEEKKGFWASLFTPKTCSCSCESNIIEEHEGDKEKPPEKPAVPCGGERIGDFLGRLLPAGFDTEDLMVVLLLLLMSGNCGSGPNMPLITMLIYLFL